MAEQEIDVYIEEKFKSYIEESWMSSIAREVLAAEGIAAPAELSLVITDAETIKQLNKAYRGEDEPTDVLAFPMFSQSGTEAEFTFITPPDGVQHLGEVIISYPQAARQAEERRQEITKELALLTVHGVLHLLGYDHEQADEQQQMKAREMEILTKAGLFEVEE